MIVECSRCDVTSNTMVREHPAPRSSDGGSLKTAGLDGFGGILFADENLQEAEFGLDPLVLSVLLQHRHAVLLLNVSVIKTGGDAYNRFI